MVWWPLFSTAFLLQPPPKTTSSPHSSILAFIVMEEVALVFYVKRVYVPCSQNLPRPLQYFWPFWLPLVCCSIGTATMKSVMISIICWYNSNAFQNFLKACVLEVCFSGSYLIGHFSLLNKAPSLSICTFVSNIVIIIISAYFHCLFFRRWIK